MHRVLELLYQHGPTERTPARAHELFPQAWGELIDSDEFLRIGLSTAQADALAAEGRKLVDQYFDVENKFLRDNVYFPAVGNHDRQGRGCLAAAGGPGQADRAQKRSHGAR